MVLAEAKQKAAPTAAPKKVWTETLCIFKWNVSCFYYFNCSPKLGRFPSNSVDFGWIATFRSFHKAKLYCKSILVDSATIWFVSSNRAEDVRKWKNQFRRRTPTIVLVADSRKLFNMTELPIRINVSAKWILFSAHFPWFKRSNCRIRGQIVNFKDYCKDKGKERKHSS